jgi:RNA polymerase sigma-70 factor (ECF subfamily)
LILFFPLAFAAIDSEGDRQLAARLQSRDPQALAELYDKYGRVAFSIIVRIVRDQGVAEDLTQETFLRVWNRMAGFDTEKGALGPWVLTVARNRAIDYLRSVDGRSRQNAIELSATETPAVFVDLEANLINSDRARQLKSAFTKLNDKQRTVIELAYFEGLSQTEMAERMKQPLGTVKTWVRSALQILRAELEQAVPA